MTTLVDLNAVETRETHASADVCVIGAGAAGLYVAARFARQGRSVIMLDAGGSACAAGSSAGIEHRFTGERYGGAEEGRAFGWGGSTSRWGGLLAPHTDADVPEADDPDRAVWDHVVRTVRDRSAAVFAALDLTGPPDFALFPERQLGDTARDIHAAGFTAIAAEFLPFSARNLTYLATRARAGAVRAFLHAVACKWAVRAGTPDEIASVTAVSAAGKTVTVTASCFVLAAGALESARVLLEIDDATQGRLFPPTAAVGGYLSDHLSLPIARPSSASRHRATRVFGPVFANGRLRSLRFVARKRDARTPRYFAHFIFESEDAGFKLAKDVLGSMQARRMPHLSFSEARDGAIGLGRLAYSRVIESRLFISRHADVRLQLDVEQSAHAGNKITLGPEVDRFGRRVPIINWQVRSEDYDAIRHIAGDVLQRWHDASIAGVALTPILGDGSPDGKPYDAYHPVGTCRMGNGENAVVGFDLRVSGTQNLFVLSTGVLPTAGTANPTFSMLCLGDKLVDDVASRLGTPAVSEASVGR